MKEGEPAQTLGPEGSEVLRIILDGTASETGEPFFRALVENLCRALETQGAWVTEFLPERRVLRALAFRLGDEWVDAYEHPLEGTPCEVSIESRRLVHYPDRILELFPHEANLRRMNAVSYMGVPLLDLDGSVLGHLAVMDRKPMPARAESLAHRYRVEISGVQHSQIARRCMPELLTAPDAQFNWLA